MASGVILLLLWKFPIFD